LLNWAARYFPVIRTLKQHGLLEQGTLLEIGSGPWGIGTFRKVPFTGCDLKFPYPPAWPMTPLVASAADLPLEDQSFDVVLALDVLEHIPPEIRTQVISESLRVARKLVIFGFPSGAAAHKADEELKNVYLSKGMPVPDWLEEHMLADFPEAELFQGHSGWKVRQFSNETIRFHSWMMRMEMDDLSMRLFRKIVFTAPNLLRWPLSLADGEPAYRQVFVLNRENES